jgi:hypothetical protein
VRAGEPIVGPLAVVICGPLGAAVGAVCGIGGGFVWPGRRAGVGGGAAEELAGRGGSWIPVGGAFRARRGGSGGRRRPHAWQTASSSAFSALQNGQNLIAG